MTAHAVGGGSSRRALAMHKNTTSLLSAPPWSELPAVRRAPNNRAPSRCYTQFLSFGCPRVASAHNAWVCVMAGPPSAAWPWPVSAARPILTEGMIGSGKTTTAKRVEDPVEHSSPGSRRVGTRPPKPYARVRILPRVRNIGEPRWRRSRRAMTGAIARLASGPAAITTIGAITEQTCTGPPSATTSSRPERRRTRSPSGSKSSSCSTTATAISEPIPPRSRDPGLPHRTSGSVTRPGR